jgi:hypothetical protein
MKSKPLKDKIYMYNFGDAVKLKPNITQARGHLALKIGRVYYVYARKTNGQGVAVIAVGYNVGRPDEWRSGWLPAHWFLPYKGRHSIVPKKKVKVWNKPGQEV